MFKVESIKSTDILIDEDEEKAKADLEVKDPEDEEETDALLKAYGVKINWDK